MSVTYDVIRSRRKTMSLEIRPDGRVVVRVPALATKWEIEKFVYSNQEWIFKHLQKVKEKQESLMGVEALSEAEIKRLKAKAQKVFSERVAMYAPLVGVSFGHITIRCQKTRWGSCSTKGNLNFNCLLMLAPMEVLDSVVVHELCHRKEMNHSAQFYREVLRVYPEYHKWNNWLKKNGSQIMQMIKK